METEAFLLLPGRRRDDGVIAAVDVMLQFAAGREPEFTAGTGGCKLAFFLTGPEGKGVMESIMVSFIQHE